MNWSFLLSVGIFFGMGFFAGAAWRANAIDDARRQELLAKARGILAGKVHDLDSERKARRLLAKRRAGSRPETPPASA